MAKTIYQRICLYCNKDFCTSDKLKKFCNLSCSTANKNAVVKLNKIQKYLQNPKSCLQCNSIIQYESRNNKFCSKSCSATYSNNKKDWTKIKTGPKPKLKIEKTQRNISRSVSRPNLKNLYTKIEQCVICNKFHPNKSKTCSTNCKRKLLSKIIKERIYNGWDPNSNRGRQKRSYLEKSFEEWLNKNYSEIHYICEQPFKRLDIVKTYFADFYFPELNLIIELDGSQHNATKDYDRERDLYIESTYDIRIVRITHKEYKSKIKLELIKNLLEHSAGIEPATSDWKSEVLPLN